MYETITEMAERLNVSKRTIQIWANSGKIPGAIKQGKMWLLPRNSDVVTDAPLPAADKARVHLRTPMPLMNMSYVPGGCLESISSMTDEESRTFAMAEFYYEKSNPQKVCDIIEDAWANARGHFKPATFLFYAFANLGLGNIQLARMALLSIKEELESAEGCATPQEKAMQVYIDNLAHAALHLPKPKNALEDYIYLLPEGMKVHASYALAYEAYLEGEYEKAIGIAELTGWTHRNDYPCALIDVHIVAAMCYMEIKKPDKAEMHLKKAWELAYPDGFFQMFGEHHSRLCGLIEKCFKKDYPNEYEQIIKIANVYNRGWRKLVMKGDENEMPEQLSATELCVAALAGRNWSNAEIGEQMHISTHTVKYYLSIVYQKIGISTRKELREYLNISGM